MEIFRELKDIDIKERCAVALGNFDGVHLGHQAIISQCVADAKEKGIKAAVFTFSTHPKNLIPGKKPVLSILDEDEKAELIENLGADYLFNIPFTEDVMTMAPETFVKELLAEKCKAKEVLCGFNYHYGFKAEGDTELLRKLGEKYDFTVFESKPVTFDGDVVSSTLIRELIKSGDVDDCKDYLGRYYTVSGEVVVGNRLGKSLGFPTSNINLDENMVTPPNGVYITYLIYNGVRYPSITNVGVKPTIGEFKKNMETHIFNFNKELYGKYIKIEFIKKIRDEVKFSSKEELSTQIAKDCNEVKAYHGL